MASVGEYQTGAALERGESGAHGVATSGDVIHEVDLPVTKRGERGFKVVLVGRGRGQVAAVAAALGFNGPGSADCLSNLSGASGTCQMPGDVRGQYSIGAGAAGAVGDGDKPARGRDERGHFASGGLEVAGGAARVFDGVGQTAGFGFGSRERTVARVGVFAGGENFHGVIARASPALAGGHQGGEGGRCGLIFVGKHYGDRGGRVVHVHRASGGD